MPPDAQGMIKKSPDDHEHSRRCAGSSVDPVKQFRRFSHPQKSRGIDQP